MTIEELKSQIPLEAEALAFSLVTCYNVFRTSTAGEQYAERALAMLKRGLAEKQNAAIREKGDELGKNATERAAALEALCADQLAAVQEAETKLQLAKHDRQLASIDLDLQRDLLRCLEIQSGRFTR